MLFEDAFFDLAPEGTVARVGKAGWSVGFNRGFINTHLLYIRKGRYIVLEEVLIAAELIHDLVVHALTRICHGKKAHQLIYTTHLFLKVSLYDLVTAN